MGMEGVKSIAQALKVQGSARTLILDDNWSLDRVAGGDAWMGVLIEALLMNTTLKSLSLRKNALTLSSAIALAIVLPRLSLDTLNLGTNHIGDSRTPRRDADLVEGFEALAHALQDNANTITCLDLSSNHMGPKGVAAIATKMRNVSVMTALDLSGEPRTSTVKREWEIADLVVIRNAYNKAN